MAKLETIQPYVEQLFEDSEVQSQLSRAAANLRGARVRAAKAKSKKQAATDRQLHRRLVAGGQALVAAGQEIARGPQKRKRRSRRGWIAAAAVAGAAGLAATPQARRRLSGLTASRETAATT